MAAGLAAGKYGRLPALFPAGLHELTHYVAGSLPKPPAAVAVPDVAAWGMLGNGPDPTCVTEPDDQGDCGVAGLAHGFMADAADTGEKESFPDSDEVVRYYLAYTGGQDTGVVLSDFLHYVFGNGFYGHSVTGYAPVNHHAHLRETVYLYDFAYLGITVTQAMEDAFAAGEPWTLATLSSPVAGGHCVPCVGYDDSFASVVTWGQVQRVSWPALHAMTDECWALITAELDEAGTDGHGVNLTALTADLNRLGVPCARATVPPDPRNGLGELARLVREIAASADRDISEIVSWLHVRGL